MARRGAVAALRPERSGLGQATLQFLSERDLAPSSRRVYGSTLDALVEDLGTDWPLGEITTGDLQAHLTARYGDTAVLTYNRHVATIGSFFTWAVKRRLLAEDPTDGLERRRERRTARQAATGRAIPYPDLEALWSRKDVALREKVLWRMLYETAGRAQEVLGLDIEDLDLGERSGRIKGKGGHIEHVWWATGTARLLPRLLGERTVGPVFLATRPPTVAVAKADVDPTTGLARLSYRRAAEMFKEASGGSTLHQLRHSALTHYAEAGVDVALLKAKSRHRSLRSLERYVQPSDAAVARLTAEHDHARRR